MGTQGYGFKLSSLVTSEESIKGKLHLTTLNNTLDYILHHKLFEYTFCTLKYDSCYTLDPNVKFAVNLDGNLKFKVQSVIKSIN